MHGDIIQVSQGFRGVDMLFLIAGIGNSAPRTGIDDITNLFGPFFACKFEIVQVS